MSRCGNLCVCVCVFSVIANLLPKMVIYQAAALISFIMIMADEVRLPQVLIYSWFNQAVSMKLSFLIHENPDNKKSKQCHNLYRQAHATSQWQWWKIYHSNFQYFFLNKMTSQQQHFHSVGSYHWYYWQQLHELVQYITMFGCLA